MTLTKKGSAFRNIGQNNRDTYSLQFFISPTFFSFMLRIVYTLLSQHNSRYWTSEIQACNLGQFPWRCTRRIESMTGIRWIKSAELITNVFFF